MRPDPVEALLEEFLARQFDGVAEGLDEFCAAHPEHADALRRRIALLGALPAAAERTVPRSFDGFEIVRELGRGGMGVVFEARQARPERRVAIKLLTAGQELSERLRERFEREIAMLARIRHPNVVKVFGSGRAGDAPYVVMELVEGDSLARRAADVDAARRPGSWREAVRLCAKIARALDHVHELGVVHRDVKPSNVLIDAAGEPVLIDFGLARGADSDSITRSGEFVGTLAYTAPEQARGERADRRADVYGLGATLFHLATGAPPYRASSIAELVRQIDAGPPGSARSVNPDVPRDLATVLEHALALRPAERYASCADLAQDLNALLSGASLSVRPRSAIAKAAAWTRRRPAAAALILVVGALSAVLALAGLRWRAERGRALQVRLERVRLELLALDAAPPAAPSSSGPWSRTGVELRVAALAREFPADRTCQWVAQLDGLHSSRRAGLLSRAVWSQAELARLEALLAREDLATRGELSESILAEARRRLRAAPSPVLEQIELPAWEAVEDGHALLRAALTLRRLGLTEQAGPILERALALAPDDRAIRLCAANMLRDRDPLAAFEHAIVLRRDLPDSPQLALSLALTRIRLAYHRNEYDERWTPGTLALVEQALASAPPWPDAWARAGYAYHELKPPELDWRARAESYYLQAIALDDSVQARFSLHNLRWQSGLREPDTVLELLAPIEASYEHWGPYWQSLAWAHEEQGDVARAVELLERSVALCAPEWLSEQLDWLIYMRGRLANGGDAAAQWRDFERLLDCTPQDTAGLERLFEAAKVVGGASRECVSEIIVERERAGVKLGKNAAALLEQIRKRR